MSSIGSSSCNLTAIDAPSEKIRPNHPQFDLFILGRIQRGKKASKMFCSKKEHHKGFSIIDLSII